MRQYIRCYSLGFTCRRRSTIVQLKTSLSKYLVIQREFQFGVDHFTGTVVLRDIFCRAAVKNLVIQEPRGGTQKRSGPRPPRWLMVHALSNSAKHWIGHSFLYIIQVWNLQCLDRVWTRGTDQRNRLFLFLILYIIKLSGTVPFYNPQQLSQFGNGCPLIFLSEWDSRMF